jgi:hypothetical protein
VLRAAADDGLDMAEVLETPLPESFASMAVMPGEFHRSVSHLYPPLERAALPPAADQGEL